VLWLTLATVAMLLVAALLVSEMAYARAAAGNPGKRGRAITSVKCSATGCIVSSTATGSTGGGPGGGSGGAGGTGTSTGVVNPPPIVTPPPPPPPCEVRACQPPPVVTHQQVVVWRWGFS
jgi:hypothetical protein